MADTTDLISKAVAEVMTPDFVKSQVATRVQKLVSEAVDDARAEGTQEPSLVPIIGACWSERDAYAKLWEAINGAGSWAANPWVWAVSFRVLSEAKASSKGPAHEGAA